MWVLSLSLSPPPPPPSFCVSRLFSSTVSVLVALQVMVQENALNAVSVIRHASDQTWFADRYRRRRQRLVINSIRFGSSQLLRICLSHCWQWWLLGVTQLIFYPISLKIFVFVSSERFDAKFKVSVVKREGRGGGGGGGGGEEEGGNRKWEHPLRV